MASDGQHYDAKLAAVYQRAESLIKNSNETCERSIFQWLQQQLSAVLPKTGTIGDFGCGSGRMLRHLSGDSRRVVGIDISRAMLMQTPVEDPTRPTPLLENNCTPRMLQEALAEHELVLVADSIEHFAFRRLMLMDAGLSCFNAVCFRNPNSLIDAIGKCLKPGAPLCLISNVFVPNDMEIDGTSPLLVDLSRHRGTSTIKPNTLFRHVLHTIDGDIPLQDYAHDLGLMADAFNHDMWTLNLAILLPAEGCTVLKPEDGTFNFNFSPVDETVYSFLNENCGFQYAKFGICVIRK